MVAVAVPAKALDILSPENRTSLPRYIIIVLSSSEKALFHFERVERIVWEEEGGRRPGIIFEPPSSWLTRPFLRS